MSKVTFPSKLIQQATGTFILTIYLPATTRGTVFEMGTTEFVPESDKNISVSFNVGASDENLILIDDLDLHTLDIQIDNETIYNPEFKVGENIFTSPQAKLSIGQTSLVLDTTLEPGYHTFFWTWEDKTHKLIKFNGSNVIQQSKVLTEQITPNTFNFNPPSRFGGAYTLLETHLTSLVYLSTSELTRYATIYKQRLDNGLNLNNADEFIHGLEDVLPKGGLLFRRDFRESDVRYTTRPFMEATPAPNNESPILVKDAAGYLDQQFFFNLENGKYETHNTEIFTLADKNYFNLSYPNIEILSLTINGEQFNNYYFNNQRVYLMLEGWQHEYWLGKQIEVTYKVRRGYFVEWNEEAAYDSYLVKLTDTDNREISIVQEGNRSHSVKLATEIDLNPMVSPQHTGFIYLDKEPQVGQAFRLSVSSNYLSMDGMDSADFIVELIDKHGNEVLSPQIDVFIMDEKNAKQSDYGSLSPIINYDTMQARNRAGRLYFRYRAPKLSSKLPYKEKLFLVAYDRQTGLGAHLPVHLKLPFYVGPNQVSYQYAQEGLPEASLPFEYFARFYEKELPAEHPLSALDVDQDGYLSYIDWLNFESNIHNSALLQTLTQALKA